MSTSRIGRRSATVSQCISLALLLGACGGTTTASGPGSEGPKGAPPAKSDAVAKPERAPFDYEALTKRELSSMPPEQHIATPDGSFEGDVFAASVPVWNKDGENGVKSFKTPFGTEGHLNCFVYPTPIDPAVVLLTIAKTIEPELELVKFHLPSVDVAGVTPVMFLSVDYHSKGAEVFAGTLKLAAESTTAGSLLCLHDEVGYHESFEKAFKGLVASVKRTGKNAGAQPLRRQVDLISSSGATLGFTETLVTEREGGGRIIVEQTHMIIPESAKTGSAHDDAELHVLDAKGTLLKAVFIHGSSGEESSDLTIERTGPKAYALSGKYHGEIVKTSFKPKSDLSYEYAKRGALRAMPDKAGAEVRYLDYVPTVARDAATEIVFRSDGAGRITLTGGDRTASVKFDARGLREDLELKVDGGSISFKRIFEKGEP